LATEVTKITEILATEITKIAEEKQRGQATKITKNTKSGTERRVRDQSSWRHGWGCFSPWLAFVIFVIFVA